MNKSEMILVVPGGNWVARSLTEMQPVTVPLTFKKVVIENRTKTCSVHIGIDDGAFVVVVTNEEEDSKFKFGIVG
jgi:hypothetical protein